MTLGSPLAPHAALAIGRARVTGAGRRAQLKRALAATALDGLGLAPDEILLVPRLSVADRLAPDGPNRPFARSFASALRARLEQAAHDPSGLVASGQAVRFSSRARMAAWLIGHPAFAATYGRGLCADVPGVTDFDDWVRKVLLPDTPSTAHCANLLFQRGQLATWMARLGDHAIGEIERGLRQAFVMPFAPVTAAPDGPHLAAPAPLPVRSGDAATLGEALAGHLAERPLSPRHRAVSAALIWCARFPGRANSAQGAAFIAGVAAATLPRTETRSAEASEAPAIRQPFHHEPEAGKPSPALLPLALSRIAGSAGTGPQHVDPPAFAISSGPQPPDRKPSPPRTAAIAPRATAHDGFPANVDDDAFTSAFCGLFYLLAPLRQLGFVSDFALDCAAGANLPPFALIDRLGAHWFGQAYIACPLHRWIARQAAPLRLPSRFVHPGLMTGENLLREAQILRDGRHCTMWHAAGYPLIDQPAGRNRRAMLALAPAGSFVDGRVRRADAARRLPAASQERWIGALARTLEAEIDRRSGDESLTRDQLRLAGRVRIIDAAMTVEFALDDLPFAVRYAGLDRDPGWLQQEGRSLAFVYR